MTRPQPLLSKSPASFQTRALRVQASAEGLSYRAIGAPLSFQAMQRRRVPLEPPNDPWQFSVELANLGVSVRLTVAIHGQDHWLLVRQQREDRGDTVLKWISGYVPAEHLGQPLDSALQEVAEECLIESRDGWLTGRFLDSALPVPYRHSLEYNGQAHFTLRSQSAAPYPVLHDGLCLAERPYAYVHLPTASLQLVYDMRLTLPAHCGQLELFHCDEILQDGRLIAALERQRTDIYLLPLHAGQPGTELFQLRQGELHSIPCHDLWLSESFAYQQGWLVYGERIAWQNWLDSANTSLRPSPAVLSSTHAPGTGKG